MTPPFATNDVRAAFAAFPPAPRKVLLVSRALIFDIAGRTEGVGPLEETLKWGQPSYLTNNTRAGTTIRLSTTKNGAPGVFVHCQSRVIPEFRALFPSVFRFDGTRGVILPTTGGWDRQALSMLIQAALTYRLTAKA